MYHLQISEVLPSVLVWGSLDDFNVFKFFPVSLFEAALRTSMCSCLGGSVFKLPNQHTLSKNEVAPLIFCNCFCCVNSIVTISSPLPSVWFVVTLHGHCCNIFESHDFTAESALTKSCILIKNNRWNLSPCNSSSGKEVYTIRHVIILKRSGGHQNLYSPWIWTWSVPCCKSSCLVCRTWDDRVGRLLWIF